MSTSFCLQVFSNASQDKDLDRKSGNCGHILPHFSDATLSWWLSWSKYSSAAKSQNATQKVNFTGENDNLAKVYQRDYQSFEKIYVFCQRKVHLNIRNYFWQLVIFCCISHLVDIKRYLAQKEVIDKQAASDSGLQLVWALHNWSLASLIATQHCSTMVVLTNCTATVVS